MLLRLSTKTSSMQSQGLRTVVGSAVQESELHCPLRCRVHDTNAYRMFWHTCNGFAIRHQFYPVSSASALATQVHEAATLCR